MDQSSTGDSKSHESTAVALMKCGRTHPPNVLVICMSPDNHLGTPWVWKSNARDLHPLVTCKAPHPREELVTIHTKRSEHCTSRAPLHCTSHASLHFTSHASAQHLSRSSALHLSCLCTAPLTPLCTASLTPLCTAPLTLLCTALRSTTLRTKLCYSTPPACVS